MLLFQNVQSHRIAFSVFDVCKLLGTRKTTLQWFNHDLSWL